MNDEQLLTLVKQAFLQAGWKAPQPTTSPIQPPTAPELPAPEPTPTPEEVPASTEVPNTDAVATEQLPETEPVVPPEIPVAS